MSIFWGVPCLKETKSYSSAAQAAADFRDNQCDLKDVEGEEEKGAIAGYREGRICCSSQ
jgi:hypothetical protein